MTALRPFALYRPATLTEASEVLAREGSETALYAGGTEVLLLLKEGLLRVASLIDLKRIPGLDEIAMSNGHLSIGATATHRAVEGAAAVQARCPLVGRVARHVANIRVRTVGTVGGNLAFADPHSDLATLFLAFDAAVRLASARGERKLALSEFVHGPYETARAEDEIVVAVHLSPWPAGTAGAYIKFGVHERPTLGVAVALMPGAALVPGAANDVIGDIRLAVGCVGPRPQRLAAAEERARGRSLADLARHVDEIAGLAARDVDPVSDLYGSAEYKRAMTEVFVRRALLLAAARAAGRDTHERYPHTVVV